MKTGEGPSSTTRSTLQCCSSRAAGGRSGMLGCLCYRLLWHCTAPSRCQNHLKPYFINRETKAQTI